MKLYDKIGLWADEKLNGLYFRKPSFANNLLDKVLIRLIPVCNHKDFETGAECKERGEPCWLPNWNESEEEAVEWYCYKHMQSNGFCRGCRNLWAGSEDFEFDPDGLCSNCRHDPDLGYDDEWDEDEYDYMDFSP